ncbi:phosphatidylinositol kinase- protein kinase tor1 [Coemansia sp. RSA 1358]|nr:armadillo-type protein [Coemansia spiralis]KAJ2619306.1 phosphatidylinositol kinase- protein kinase tor1 [Coemansia sp. RSA 1358]
MLRKQIVAAEASGKHGSQNPVYVELNAMIMRLARANDVQDRLACTAILTALVDIDMLEDTQKTRITAQLKTLLNGNNPVVCLEAAFIYGKLIQKKWAVVMASVEPEVSRCLEWLAGERSEVRRLTALKLIEVLCIGAPTSLYSYIPKILTSLSPPLRDHRLEMRDAAARALGACLDLVPMQDQTTRNPWLNYLFEELQRDHQLASTEGYHAALLVCQELVLHGGMYMQSHYGNASEMALKLKDHRDPVVHKTAINLLPMLARYSPQDFARLNVGGETLLARTCNYLITLSRTSSTDRATAFVALAHIAQSCSSDFRVYLEPTTRAIRDVLLQRAKSRVPPSEADETAAAMLNTIAILASAMGPALTRYMREILDLMFTTGLSKALCDSLAVLEREVNQLQPAIQDRLLDMVSIILVNVPFRPTQPSLDRLEQRMGAVSLHYATATGGGAHSGDKSSGGGLSTMALGLNAGNTVNGSTMASPAGGGLANGPGATGNEPVSLVVSAASNIPLTNEILVLALHTLSSFNFSEENLSEFVRNDVLEYLSHSSAAVRKEAINAVSHIVLSDPLYKTMAGAGVEVASEVVQRLVSAAVTDLDPDVRLMAARMLEKGTCFDFHMGKAQNIQSLFLLLNDEVFEVRLTILGVIGRLANMNPAHVMPSLRRMVVQLLTELEFSQTNSEREECIQLLMVLVRAAENWVRPYVGDIFRTILPRIDDGPPQLSSKLLDTVAALAQVGGSDLVPHLDKLLSSIMNALSDQTSVQKNMSALKALSSCASFCGMVIDPYIEYPLLFDILTGMLKNQPDKELRLEIMRVIGSLGAVDPHKYKDAKINVSGTYGGGGAGGNTTDGGDINDAHQTKIGSAGKKDGKKRIRKTHRQVRAPPPNVMTVFNGEKPRETLVGDIPVDAYGTTFSGDVYYTSVSVNALLRILDNPADTMFHQQAVQALITMSSPLQNACAPYLDRVVPAILRAMAMSPPGKSEFYIESLGRLVGIARQLIRPYLEPLFGLFATDKPISDQQQAASIGLIEVLAEALSGDFGPHISIVLPFLITVIDRDTSESLQPTLRSLHALQILSPSLEGYLFLVMPRLISLLNPTTTPLGVIEADLECISSIVSAVNCGSFASRIVLTLVRLLQCAPTQALQTATIDTLCTLMEQLQDDFTLFMPTINAAMKKRGIVDHVKYERYSRLLFSGRLIPKDAQRVQPLLHGDALQSEASLGQPGEGMAKFYVDAMLLRRAWSTTQRVSKEDWIGWLNRFSVELLQQSPSPALRACASLAFKNPKLCSELFNAGFVSCWTELPGQYQQEIITSLQDVASNPDVPSDILQTILSLAGFMERDEKQIPIDLKLLGDYADRCHALAKELHYKEAEWTLEKNYETIEKLIELNQNLDLHDSAIGMLNHVRNEQPDIEESVEWYLRLQRWDEALAIYQRQEAENGPSHINLNGQIRCLFEMSDWETLIPMYDRIWRGNDHQLQLASANIGMSMAWAMGDIDRMEFYLSTLPNMSKDKSFCRALLSVYHNKFDEAIEHINDARNEMEMDLVSHITESYSRGYSQVFRCQMLTELEEVIAYKTAHDDKERRGAIISTWRRRLEGIQQDVGMWQKILRLRSMVLRPVLDLDTWIKYVNMCRNSDQMKIARHAISQLLEDEARYLEEIHTGETDSPSTIVTAHAHEYMRLRAQLDQQQQGHQQQLQRGYQMDGMVPRSSGYSSWNGQQQQNISGNAALNDASINAPLDTAIRISQQPALVYMYLKYKWAANERRDAFQMLEMFSGDYSSKIGFDPRNPDAFADHMDARAYASVNNQADAAEDAKVIHFLARFYFKRAEWLSSIQQNASLAQEARSKAGIGINDTSYTRIMGRSESISMRRPRLSISAGTANGTPGSDMAKSLADTKADQDAEFLFKLKGERINESILESYRAATVLDRKWYKAWHSLALRHYYETQKYDTEHANVSVEIIDKHVVPAVHGFFRAIQLSKSDTTLQDTLRLLTAWFNYSQHEGVAQAVLDGFNSVPIRTWLQVIPQILARIHIKFESTSRLIRQLLTEVGKFHPHAILFSLYVAARSDHPERSQAAKDVLAKLHDLSPELVEETEVVSRELIRITLLFPEMWQEALDNASKCYYGQRDPVEMMKILAPLHERARNPETLREYHFVQMFGNDLASAEEHLNQYFSAEPGHRNDAFLQQAWELYYIIFRRIQKLFPEPTSLALKDTAPTLLQCRDMHLAVPGTYDPDRELVHIESFDPVVHVYNTKQHPRRVCIHGSDGNRYTFILKGHEDLRQDERVMQLFGLVNSLLMRDNETARRSLAIERFPVIPLSSNSGLIGFYPNCETIHEIIRFYREAHNQPLNLEQRMALQFSPNYESLTVMQKVESFEYALSNTPGNDLQRAMWYKSPSAEVWLERRTNYTRSMAVMSIAGYILGLGDRHPSNIMMHERSGKIVHIDFGDCFEVAAHREKYPERVPFRLTRMIIMPMEVGTIEGSFKFTANHTMRVLRANRDSLMAVLEAFVFDPLVSWSYIQETDKTDEAAANITGGNRHRVRGPAGANGATHNAAANHEQATRWTAPTRNENISDIAIMGGSRPDDMTGKMNKQLKHDGVDDKGWQVGNPKARAIVKRIHDKLRGTDFDSNVQLPVAAQIDKLIDQATSSENLAVLYVGWVPLW